MLIKYVQPHIKAVSVNIMRHAISYVSTASSELSTEQIKNLLDQTFKKNNCLDISGFLICSEKNFFQLLEGEKEIILELFSIITKDLRHHSLIKIVDKPVVSLPINHKYYCDFITENTRIAKYQIAQYLPYTKALDLNSQQAVTRILEAMIH